MQVSCLALPEPGYSPRPPLRLWFQGAFFSLRISNSLSQASQAASPPCLQLLPLYIAGCQGCFRILADRFYFFPDSLIKQRIMWES